MRASRQKIQLEPALEPVAKGEARSAGGQGTEARMARADLERPAAKPVGGRAARHAGRRDRRLPGHTGWLAKAGAGAARDCARILPEGRGPAGAPSFRADPGRPPKAVARNEQRFLADIRARKRCSIRVGAALAPDSNLST